MTPASDRRSILVSSVRLLSSGALVALLTLLISTLISYHPIDLPLAFCFLSLALAGFSFAHWYEQARGFPLAALYFGAIAGCGLAILLAGDLSPRTTGGVIGLNLLGAGVGGLVMRWYHRSE